MRTSSSIYQLIEQLFPINRSITGEGLRQSLAIIQKEIPLKLHQVPSGTSVLDWTVPPEWNVSEAYIEDQKGKRIVDFKNNNLHLLGYSIPVDEVITLKELQSHLYSLPKLPTAIPYVTSYYEKRWGFCLSHKQRAALKPGKYHVYINSSLAPGNLNYADLVIPGQSKEEVLFSTYVCHPSLANDNLSGPAVATYLAKWLMQQKNLHYTYRFVFVPETIGAVTYLSKNLGHLRKHVKAGFVLTCLGDTRTYSFMPSRFGDTLADKIVLTSFKELKIKFKKYSFLKRGSDERQYCSPGADLPVVSVVRSKYSEYPEYHTSLDNLKFISPRGLEESYNFYLNCIQLLEMNRTYKITCVGEPQLGKRNLFPSLSFDKSYLVTEDLVNFLAYADGKHDLIDIGEVINVSLPKLDQIATKLLQAKLLSFL